MSTSAGHPSFMSPHSKPIVKYGDYIYVVNMPPDTVDIINMNTRVIINRINIAVDPVGTTVRPDGK